MAANEIEAQTGYKVNPWDIMCDLAEDDYKFHDEDEETTDLNTAAILLDEVKDKYIGWFKEDEE